MGHLRGAALGDAHMPFWHRQMQTQSWKVDLQPQSPRSRACPMQEWEMRPLWLLQAGPRGIHLAQL